MLLFTFALVKKRSAFQKSLRSQKFKMIKFCFCNNSRRPRISAGVYPKRSKTICKQKNACCQKFHLADAGTVREVPDKGFNDVRKEVATQQDNMLLGKNAKFACKQCGKKFYKKRLKQVPKNRERRGRLKKHKQRRRIWPTTLVDTHFRDKHENEQQHFQVSN